LGSYSCSIALLEHQALQLPPSRADKRSRAAENPEITMSQHRQDPVIEQAYIKDEQAKQE
jgi:hypothetical protein